MSNPSLPFGVSTEDLEGDLIRPGDALFGLVWINPERVSGAPCFFGTRVPIKNLFDSLRAGRSIDYFLDGYPGVTKEQVLRVLDLADRRLVAARGAAA